MDRPSKPDGVVLRRFNFRHARTKPQNPYGVSAIASFKIEREREVTKTVPIVLKLSPIELSPMKLSPIENCAVTVR